MKHIIALFILATLPNLNSYAQCILVDFTSKDTVCLNEAVELYNYSESGDQYQWYTCLGNLLNNTNSKQINIGNNAFRASYGFTNIGENNVHYGITIRNAGLVYRFVYNNELSQISDLVQLPDERTFFSSPRNIKILKSGRNLVGLVTNSGGSINLTRLNFGSSIFNNPTHDNISSMTPFTNTNGLEIIEESGNFYAYAGKNAGNEVSILNFGDDLLNNPAVNTFTIPDASGITGIALKKYCGTYYGLVTSYTNNKLFKLDFSSGPNQPPSIEEVIISDPGFLNPARVMWAIQNGDFFAFIQTDGGYIFRLFLGNSPENEPTIDVIPEISENCYAFDILETNDGKFKYLAVDYVNATKGLFSLSFDNECINDGVVSEEYNPTNLSFNDPGNQIIKLVITDDQGNFNSTSDTIYVRDQVSPETNFTTEGNCVSMPIEFTLSSEAIDDIDSLLWDFGDGSGTASGQNVNYQFLDTGSYEVNLSIDAMNGCSNTARKIVPIYNPPQAGFTFPTGILCSNSPVDFINNTTFYGPDSIITYNWNFNEEAFLSAKDTSFIFNSGGDKNITLTASIPGCTSEASEIISITPGPLTAFAFDGTCVHDVFQFTNSTTGDDITGYLWDFGDGYSSTNLSPTHQYTSGGTYPVSLTAFNALGCQSTLQQVVPVRYIPSPNFTNDLACSENTVKFYDQSSVPHANITEQYWTLMHNESGFEASQTGPSPSFQLGTPGEYRLELIVKSNYGCTDTLVRNDVTVKPSPIADFSILETCLGDSTLFMEQAEFPDSTELNSAEWLIDGKLYSGPDVKHQFTLPDEYEIEMFLRSSNFCTDHITKTIQILPLPDLDIALSALCAEQPVMINALVNAPFDPVISYHWEIDNTPISTSESFNYEFGNAQNYLISLEVETENDCFNSLDQNFTIHPSPVSEFELFPSIGASPLEVSFTDLSFGASRVTYDFSDFNDDISHELNPVYTYMELGKDWPKQIAENEFGCADTSYSEIEVVIPVYDLVITDTRIEVMDQKLSMIVELTNNGTIIVNNPDLHIDIDKTITLNHKLEGRLMPGDVQSFPIDFDVILDNKPINYLCFNLNMTFGDYEDVNPYDNTSCLSLENTVNVLEPYPNPSRKYVNFPVILPSGSHCEMIMTGEKGDIVYQKEFQALNEGLNLIRLDLATFAQGIYLVNIKLNDFETTKKVILR